MTTYCSNGLGYSLGAYLTTCKPLAYTGTVYYVSSVTGSSLNSGLSPELAKSTLNGSSGAVAAASAGDTIVLMGGHTETISAALALNKQLTILGTGWSNGKPGVTLNITYQTGAAIAISAANVRLENIYIPHPSPAVAHTYAEISVGAAGARIAGVYFELSRKSASTQGPAIDLAAGGDYCTIENCFFVSEPTDPTNRCDPALTDSAAVTGLRVSGCTFDGNVYGWRNYVVNLGTTTNLIFENVSLLRGSDILLTSCTGIVNFSSSTGESRVVW